MTDHAPPSDTPITVARADPPPLRPADPQDVLHALAFALRYQGRRRVDTAGEMIARIAAGRIAEHLARSGFVVMRLPEPLAGPDRHYGPNVPGQSDTPRVTGDRRE